MNLKHTIPRAMTMIGAIGFMVMSHYAYYVTHNYVKSWVCFGLAAFSVLVCEIHRGLDGSKGR